MDNFAQDLWHLFHKAYPTTALVSKEAEEMGEVVQASQLAARLLPELKIKVARSDSSLEKLLTKARFEEVRKKEMKSPKITKVTTHSKVA